MNASLSVWLETEIGGAMSRARRVEQARWRGKTPPPSLLGGAMTGRLPSAGFQFPSLEPLDPSNRLGPIRPENCSPPRAWLLVIMATIVWARPAARSSA